MGLLFELLYSLEFAHIVKGAPEGSADDLQSLPSRFAAARPSSYSLDSFSHAFAKPYKTGVSRIAPPLPSKRPSYKVNSGAFSRKPSSVVRMFKYGEIYSKFETETQRGIREAAFIDDVGQNSWLRSRGELRDFTSSCEIDKSTHLLDLGCGTGGVSHALVEMFDCQVTGLDSDATGIGRAQASTSDRQRAARATFICSDLNSKLPLDNGTFDVILSIDTIVHVTNRSLVFSEAFRVLKSSGRFIFTDAGVLTGSISQDERAARATMAPICFSRPGEIEQQLTRAGFSVLAIRNVTDPLLEVADARLKYITSHEHQAVTDMGLPWVGEQRRYLSTLRTMTEEGRLSRFLYSAVKR